MVHQKKHMKKSLQIKSKSLLEPYDLQNNTVRKGCSYLCCLAVTIWSYIQNFFV